MPDREFARHFAGIAARYTGLRSKWPLGTLRRQEIAALQALVRPQPGDLVLDAGCGDGETLSWLATLGVWAVGLDIVPAMVAHCRRRGQLVVVQDMEQLGIRARFDWVLCIGALEFASQPQRVIAGLSACLRRGGRFVLLFPRRGWPGTVYAVYHRTHGVRIHLFSCEEIRASMRAAGLQPQGGWRDCWLSTVALATRADNAAGVPRDA
jgi:SAM-dependent methyltransferase